MTYTMIKKLIERDRTDGLLEKVNVFYLNNQLTKAQYEELVGLLTPQ